MLALGTGILTMENTFKISEKALRDARTMKVSDETMAAMLANSNASLTEIPFSDAMREVLHSRSAQESPKRYPLFAIGHTAHSALQAVIGSPDTCSKMSRDIDFPLVGKVGPQGARFSADYLVEFLLNYYDRVDHLSQPKFRSGNLSPRMAKAVAEVKQILWTLIGKGKIKPLTWEEAVDAVCSKDAACWPLGGNKTDPSVRQWLLDHPYSEETRDEVTALVGQRFQRNKHNDTGMPIPRLIFNADVRAVALAAMYEAPLVEALQNINPDVLSPFCELNGVQCVGSTILKWVNSAKVTEFESVEVDVKSMDTAYTIEHAKVAYDIIRTLFSDDRWLWESIELSFSMPAVLSESKSFRGIHSLFSGVTWTHLLESILSFTVQTHLAHSVRLLTKDGTGDIARAVGLNHWGHCLIMVCGDDAALLIRKPSNTEYGDGDCIAADIRDIAVAVYGEWGLPTAQEKVAVRKRYVNYCSKTYSNKAVHMDAKGIPDYYRPVYSPTMSVLNVLFPEYPLTDPSIVNEVLRVAMIVDQSYGSEHWNRLADWLCNSIGKADIEKLTEIMTSFAAESDSAIKALGKAAPWMIQSSGWEVQNSPFISYLTKWLGLTSSEKAELRTIISDVVRFRVLHWRYHMFPDDVLEERTSGNFSRNTYKAFFRDEAAETGTGKAVIRPDIPTLSYALSHESDNSDSPCVPLRDPANYRADKSFYENFDFDDPMAEYGRPRPVQSDKAEPVVINGISVKDDNFWD